MFRRGLIHIYKEILEGLYSHTLVNVLALSYTVRCMYYRTKANYETGVELNALSDINLSISSITITGAEK